MAKERIVRALIVLAGLINFAPVIGAFSGARIESLYGVELADPTLEILLRHRAVLFGLLGGFMIIAAFKRQLHATAIIGGLIAMLSFIGFYYVNDDQPASLMSIVYADIVGVVLLGLAGFMNLVESKQRIK